jgi:hypothetical protein
MFTALWRRLWNGDRVRSQGKCLRGNRHSSYQPSLESLEGREVPAVPGGGLIAPAVPYVFSAPAVPYVFSLPHQAACQLPGRTSPFYVTVAQNSPETVIDLGWVFAAVPGLQHEDGLQFSVLGNTNPALVRTELSDAALILTYMRGQSGTSTIVVCATDADGVSVQQRILVTVRPLSAVGIGPTPATAHLSTPLGT